MAEFLRRYKLHIVLVILGLGILVLGLAIWIIVTSKTAQAKNSKSGVHAIDTVYYKERLKRLTDGSRYGSNSAICQQALTVYYERKTEAEVKKALQTIQTQCRLSKR